MFYAVYFLCRALILYSLIQFWLLLRSSSPQSNRATFSVPVNRIPFSVADYAFDGPEARGRHLPFLPLPSLLPFLPLSALLSPSSPVPLSGESGGSPPESGGSGVLPRKNVEFLHCCRWVLANSGMLKVVWKCVCFRSQCQVTPIRVAPTTFVDGQTLRL